MLVRNNPDFTNLHLIILIFLIISLPIHAGKEVDAMGAYQVDRAFPLTEMRVRNLIFIS